MKFVEIKSIDNILPSNEILSNPLEVETDEMKAKYTIIECTDVRGEHVRIALNRSYSEEEQRTYLLADAIR